MGSAEGRSPSAEGTGVSPVFGFTTPFLARACPEPVEGKGDGGMVERTVGHRRHRSDAEVLRQSPIDGLGMTACPQRGIRGLASKPLSVHRTGCAEGRSPFAGGTGVSPVFGFTTPFLARKGDGGMVETVVGYRRYKSAAEVSRQSPVVLASEVASAPD